MKSRSSGQVRGIQLLDPLKGNFYDTETRSFIGDPGFHKTIVFVRSFEPGMAHQLKQRGHIIGFDVIDRAVSNLHILQRSQPNATDIDWSTLAHGLIDFYIVNNTKSGDALWPHVNKKQKVYVIPHHAATYELVEREDKKPKIVGYVGLPDQIDHSEKIEEHVKDLGLEFMSGHPRTREESCEMLSMIDIGIVFLERNNRTAYVLDYKPNQKLSNFQCFGIPTVICDYDSFKEFGDNAFLLSETIDDALESITRIVKDDELRKDLRARGYEAGKNLLRDYVSLYYRRMVSEVQQGQQ